jgi:thiol reductant ABC exporter CydD subunit
MSVERRLGAQARPVRVFVALSVGLGTLTAVAVLLQAWLLAGLVSTSFTDRVGPADLVVPLAALLGVVLVRAGLAWAIELAAHRASARTKSDLRRDLLSHAMRLGPHRLAGRRTAQLETLATRGLDALDAYFARYLPSLVLAFVVPTAVVAVVAVQDPLSALVMGVTLPLVPLFMALVGIGTKRLTARRLAALQRLGAHFLDSVEGLGTLKVFGRSAERVREVGQVTDTLRRETMGTLRVAFLSSLVLELLASLSVAVVAVAVGLRLVAGDLALSTGLFVLVLAPEAYLPLRRLGAQFHSSADGVAAATKVFEVLDTPLPPTGGDGIRALPGAEAPELALDGVTVRFPGRSAPALDRVSLRVPAGSVVALTGPSGCGKSTLLQVLLGMLPVDAGRVSVDDVDLAAVDVASWRRLVAWVPQHPHLFATSLLGNITLGRPDAPPDQIDRAVQDARLGDLVARLPRGLEAPVGERGFGLSAGERQRLALARAFVLDAPVLLLDEPTANLDGDTEAAVLAAIRRMVTGRTVVIAAHRPSLVALADHVVSLDRPLAEALP